MIANQEQSQSHLDLSKDFASQSQANISQLGKSRISTSRRSPNNEFLTNQLDPNRVGEYISLLSEFERTSINDRKFKDAELAAQRIEELKQQEVEYRTMVLEEKSKAEMEELEKATAIQAEEFTKLWDKLVNEHIEEIKNIEQDMILAHEEELRRFDEEVNKLVVPKTKFSRDVINMQHVMNGLIKGKKYSEAEGICKKLEALQKKETEKWFAQFREKYIRKRQLLLTRQANELQVLQEKLQNSLHEKLRMRASEQDRLFQRFQNMKNELELRYSQELSKMNLLCEKVRKSCDLLNSLPPKSSTNRSFYASSRMETSKLVNQSHVDN